MQAPSLQLHNIEYNARVEWFCLKVCYVQLYTYNEVDAVLPILLY